jgi:hypothetical protein
VVPFKISLVLTKQPPNVFALVPQLDIRNFLIPLDRPIPYLVAGKQGTRTAALVDLAAAVDIPTFTISSS